MKTIKILSLVLLVLLVAVQFYPRVSRDNPPATSPIEAPPELLAVLERSCFDCHSRATRWPWYSRIAPVSWLIAGDVSQARALIDFSVWGELDSMARRYNEREILTRVEDGEMPPRKYLWLHPDARIKPGDLETIRDWASR